MAGKKTVLVWFRKSLRMHDNAALRMACDEAATVLPVFILDKWTSKESNVGNVRFEFLMQSLRCLDKNLKAAGSPRGLLFIQGEPEKVLPALSAQFSADAVAFDDSEENEIHDRQRDASIAATVPSYSACHSHWLHSPLKYERALKGKPVPTTYSQFLKLFASLGSVPQPLDAPHCVPSALTKQEIDDMCATLPFDVRGVPPAGELRPPVDIKFLGGEDEGLRRLAAMVTSRPDWAAQFEKPKTKPNSLEPSTTVLSPYLTHGCVSMRRAHQAVTEAYRKAQGRHSNPPVSLIGQFLWREHWYAIAHFTAADLSKMSGNPLSRQIPWDDVSTDKDARDRLERWTNGTTGFPFIDAVMTQLRLEGWIHHLGRHAVACFLTRGDLWISWEEGFKVFDRLLIDADHSLNACNWMWLSCSAFFHQFFRCYSPVAFGKKTDPDGAYIRKYIPQLAKMPKRYIYEPWKAPIAVQREAGCIIGKDYPRPIVADHRVTSKENMGRMKKAFDAHKAKKASAGGKKKKQAKLSFAPPNAKRIKVE